MDQAQKNDRNAIQVIGRAAQVLRTLAEESGGLSLTDISQRVGLPRSTVQRIVGALIEEDFLVTASGRGRVKLGAGIARLGAATDMKVEAHARTVMERVAKETGETVDLSVPVGNMAKFIDQVSGTKRLVVVSHIGDQFPLYCTANGKAMLAAMPPMRRRSLLSGELGPLTDRTIIEKEAFLAELNSVEQHDLAYDRDEHTMGISAVGTALIDPMGRIYAISIPLPSDRFAASQQALANTLLDAKKEILARISGSWQ